MLRETKLRGFTLVEILIMVFILALAVRVVIKWQIARNEIQLAKTYADQTKIYTDAFIKYLSYNKSLMQQVRTEPFVISWESDEVQKYVSKIITVTKLNLFQQAPCLWLGTKSDPSTLAYPLLFYAGGKAPSVNISTKAMATIGGMAAIYNDNSAPKNPNTVMGTFGLWSYPFPPDFHAATSSPCDKHIPNNSLVINLGMMDLNVQSSDVGSDYGLHRIEDKNHKLGESKNTNTATTDISISKTNGDPNKLYVDNNKDSYFSQQNIAQGSPNLGLNKGEFMAKSLVATSSINSGESCDKSLAGSISAQKIDPNSNILQGSSLVCSFNPLLCRTVSAPLRDYCYLSQQTTTIRYTNKNGKLPNTFRCPASVPIMNSFEIDTNNNKIHLVYRQCSLTALHDKCDAMTATEPNDKDLLDFYTNNVAITWTPIVEQINRSGINYSVTVGYDAKISHPAFNCDSTQCGLLVDQTKYPNYFVSSTEPHCVCYCRNSKGSGSVFSDIRKVEYTNPNPIQSVTCTSKLIITQQ